MWLGKISKISFWLTYFQLRDLWVKKKTSEEAASDEDEDGAAPDEATGAVYCLFKIDDEDGATGAAPDEVCVIQ